AVAVEKYGLVGAGGESFFERGGDLGLVNLLGAEEDGAVASNGYDQRVFLFRVVHILGGIHSGALHRSALLNHGSDHHEDDQEDEHDVRHGDDVGAGDGIPGLWFVCHGCLLLDHAAARDEIVHQFHRGIVHLDVEGLDLV